MSTAENKALINRYLAALSGQEKPAAVVDEYISDADAVLKGHIVGYEAAFPRYAMDTEEMLADEDKVVVRFTLRATYAGGFMNIPATGQQVAMPGIIIYRIADGKIVEHWMEVDSMALMQQLGMQPQAA
jgi:predicted ester cyclase